ncbi:MAG: Na+/H+ antiporter family protein [Plesiomonas shigelloides]
MNAVVIAVSIMLLLSLMRVNVVIALTFSAIIGGLLSGMSLTQTVETFTGGLGGGAEIALSYAMLGTFAVAISRSGITDVLAQYVIKRLGREASANKVFWFKYMLLLAITLIAISSQNAIPIHIAFIPILIPPLLHVMAQLKLDRRAVACAITFGLTAPYMILPVGFGGIFLNNILLQNLNNNGLSVTAAQVPSAMALPVAGMVVGLFTALFISYRKPRHYDVEKILAAEPEKKEIQTRHLWVAGVAILGALSVQLYTNSIILGALMGFIVFIVGGVINWRDTQDVFSRGVQMMAMIGFIMITASGFAAVMKATGSVETLVHSITDVIGHNSALGAFLMLVVGLLITMGIGSSFSTVPIIATIYVPLCISFGFSPMATIALVGVAGALGDAGSPASDSTLGPTSGLNMDDQHDHIWDTVVPTFIHYNIPLLIFGWIAAMIL